MRFIHMIYPYTLRHFKRCATNPKAKSWLNLVWMERTLVGLCAKDVGHFIKFSFYKEDYYVMNLVEDEKQDFFYLLQAPILALTA